MDLNRLESIMLQNLPIILFVAFPQFFAYYACYYAFQKYIMLSFCALFSLCREVLQMIRRKWRNVTPTATYG